MNRIVTLAGAAMIATVSHSQAIVGSVNLNANLTQLGNPGGKTSTTGYVVTADGNTVRYGGNVALKALLAFSRQRVNGVSDTTEDRWSIGGRWDKISTNQFFPYAGIKFDRDGVIDLDLRTTLSAGFSTFLKPTPEGGVTNPKDWSWRASLGAAYVTEKYSNDDNNFFGVELSYQYLRALAGGFNFSHNLSFIPDVSETSNYVASFDMVLSKALSSNMDGKFAYIVDYSTFKSGGITSVSKQSKYALLVGFRFNSGN